MKLESCIICNSTQNLHELDSFTLTHYRANYPNSPNSTKSCTTCLSQTIWPFLKSTRNEAELIAYNASKSWSNVNKILFPADSKPKLEIRYLCSCGQSYEFQLDLRIHIDEFCDPLTHRENGEIHNGKTIIRDTDKIGDPIVKTQKPKSYQAKVL